MAPVNPVAPVRPGGPETFNHFDTVTFLVHVSLCIHLTVSLANLYQFFTALVTLCNHREK